MSVISWNRDKENNHNLPVFWLTAQRRGAPVDGNALVAAALGVRRHAGAETLAVASTTAGARVCQAVHVEPGDIHLKQNKHFPAVYQEQPQGWVESQVITPPSTIYLIT